MTFDELQRSIKRGNLKQVEDALHQGVDVDLCNNNGWTLLMLAAHTGNTAIGELLIERGADLNARTKHPQSYSQQSPLAIAAMSGKPSFVRLLLDRGASLDASPYPGTFESYIEWLEKYSAASPEQLSHIRSVVEAEKLKRSANGK
jgi:ankyrin repeat protein